MDAPFSPAERRMLAQARRESGTWSPWLPWVVFAVAAIAVVLMVAPDIGGGGARAEEHGPNVWQRIGFGGVSLCYVAFQAHYAVFRKRALLLIQRLAPPAEASEQSGAATR